MMINVTNRTNQNVAEVILSQLEAWGVQHMYGVSGDAILPLLEQTGKQVKIKYFGVRHESSAAFMASAEGKCTNRLGVCIGTSGPGLANMLNGIADAAADHVPMLVITGQVEMKKVGTESKQYVEQQQLISPLAVYSAILLHPDATVTLLHKAIIEALSKRGVAHLTVPKDLFSLPCTHPIHTPVGVIRTERREDYSQLNEAIELLCASKKPIVYIGEGARSASNEVILLAEKLQAGIIETLGAKGIVPYDHPLYVGGIGEGGSEESAGILKESDCVVVIGANWWPTKFVPKNTKVINIDVSAANIELHPNVAYGIVGDAANVLPHILHQLHEHVRKEWKDKIQQAKSKIDSQLDKERSNSSTPIAPQRLIAAIDETATDDAIIVSDTGDHTVWFNRVFRAKRHYPLFSGKWRTMGFGLPAAISAKIQYPDKQVVALVGDGGFTMTMMELSTALHYDIPITVVVVNNESFGKEESSMKAKGMDTFGVKLTNPNFAQLAKSFGAEGIRVEQVKDLVPALKEAYGNKKLTIVEVMTSTNLPPFA